jgi:hypothetical protein
METESKIVVQFEQEEPCVDENIGENEDGGEEEFGEWDENEYEDGGEGAYGDESEHAYGDEYQDQNERASEDEYERKQQELLDQPITEEQRVDEMYRYLSFPGVIQRNVEKAVEGVRSRPADRCKRNLLEYYKGRIVINLAQSKKDPRAMVFVHQYQEIVKELEKFVN